LAAKIMESELGCTIQILQNNICHSDLSWSRGVAVSQNPLVG